MIARYLSNIDLFGTPVSINFSGKEKATTSFGGLCSILFFAFLGWTMSKGIQDLFSTENPQIISYESYSEDPEEMILSLDEFPIAFAMRTPTDLSYQLYVDDSIFKINLFHSMLQRTTLDNGTTVEDWINTPINIEKCKPGYFGELANSFSNLNLDAMFCISRKQSELAKLRLQGVFTSKVYQSLTATISQCDDNTSKVPCASPEVINTYLNGGWFSTLYGNMVVNPRDFEHPNFKFKDLYYTMLSTENYRETEIELGRVQMTTDKGWIVESPNIETYVKVNKITEFLQFEPNPQKVLISCIFQLSKLENYYSRTYKKVPGVLAEIGGLANAALMILFIVTNPYFKLKFRESLMNELFEVRAFERMPSNTQPKDLKRKPNNNLIKRNKKSNRSFENTTKTFSHLKKELRFDLNEDESCKKINTVDPSPIEVTKSSNRKLNLDNINITNLDKISASIKTFNSLTASPITTTNRKTKRYTIKEPTINQSDSPKLTHNRILSMNQARTKLENLNIIKSAQVSLNDLDIFNRNPDTKDKVRIDKEKSTPLKPKFLEEENIDKCSFSIEIPGDGPGKLDKRGETEYDDKEINFNTEENAEKGLSQTPRPTEEKSLDGIKSNNGDSESSENNEVEIISRAKPTKIDVTILEFLGSFFYKSRSLKQKMRIIQEGVQKIDERLDVVNILKKLREIDKLKALLLDHDQLVLFNNLPKPEIFPRGFKRMGRGVPFAHSVLKQSKFIEEVATEQQVLNSFEEIRCKENKTPIDEKLLEIFSERNKSLKSVM